MSIPSSEFCTHRTPVWRWYVDTNGGFFHRCKSYFAFDIGFIYMLYIYIYSNLAEPMEYI